MAKRYCALALCLALLLTAAGCGAAEPGDVRTGDTASEGVTYTFRELELPEGLTPSGPRPGARACSWRRAASR